MNFFLNSSLIDVCQHKRSWIEVKNFYKNLLMKIGMEYGICKENSICKKFVFLRIFLTIPSWEIFFKNRKNYIYSKISLKTRSYFDEKKSLVSESFLIWPYFKAEYSSTVLYYYNYLWHKQIKITEQRIYRYLKVLSQFEKDHECI